MQQAHRHCQSLFVACRQVATARIRLQVEAFDGIGNTPAQLRAGKTISTTEELQVLTHTQIGVQREFL